MSDSNSAYSCTSSLKVHVKTNDTYTALGFIEHGRKIMEERAKEYNAGPQGERSFNNVATAFNAITGHNLRGSEIALIQQILKDVRQWTNPSDFHFDSAIDNINYSALKSELFYQETN